MKKHKEFAGNITLDNIQEGDPQIAELIKDCYRVLKDRQNDGLTNFFEGGLIKQIEDMTSDVTKVRERQSEGLMTSLQKLLELRDKNKWIQSEKESYEYLKGALFAELFGKEGEIYEVLGEFIESIMRLDYSKTLPTFSIDGIKTNIFNQFGFGLDQIAQTIANTTISKKSMNAFFEIQSDFLIFVTDKNFEIRSTNGISDDLYSCHHGQLRGKNLFTIVPELGVYEVEYCRLQRVQNEQISINIPDVGMRRTEVNFVKCVSDDEVTEFLFALDFKVIAGNIERNLFENYSLLNNVIRGLHEFRSDLYGKRSLETTSDLLQNLYQLREKSKSELLKNSQNENQSFNEIIDFNLLHRHISQEVRFLPNIENVNLVLSNNIVRPVYGNYELLFSIVKNLVGNAIKFQDENKETTLIKIGCSEGNSGIEIIVEDNGIGIDKVHLDKIFDRGYTVNSNSDDLGIGLNLTRKSVSYLGGTISVESTSSSGSTFKVQLPM